VPLKQEPMIVDAPLDSSPLIPKKLKEHRQTQAMHPTAESARERYLDLNKSLSQISDTKTQPYKVSTG